MLANIPAPWSIWDVNHKEIPRISAPDAGPGLADLPVRVDTPAVATPAAAPADLHRGPKDEDGVKRHGL